LQVSATVHEPAASSDQQGEQLQTPSAQDSPPGPQSRLSEQSPSEPSWKHVPAQLQPAPGTQPAPLRQSKAAAHPRPALQVCVLQAQAPSAPQVWPPHLAASCSSQRPLLLGEKHVAGSHEQLPSTDEHSPPLRQSLRWSQSAPDVHWSKHAQSPLGVQSP